MINFFEKCHKNKKVNCKIHLISFFIFFQLTIILMIFVTVESLMNLAGKSNSWEPHLQTLEVLECYGHRWGTFLAFSSKGVKVIWVMLSCSALFTVWDLSPFTGILLMLEAVLNILKLFLETHTHTHTHTHLQCITKVSTPLTFLLIFKYISSWDNTDKMKLWHNEK